MRISLDKEKKIILLKWLKQGYINTMDMPELLSDSDNAFLQLMQSLPDEEDSE
jgi:hypothetical protein